MSALPAIDVQEVFVQGSSDAVLMAWNTMDTYNKKEHDVFNKICFFEGVKIDALTFMDDIIDISKSVQQILNCHAKTDVFQDENRFNFKATKCKLMIMNKKENIIDTVNNSDLEIVEDHIYLGTVVSSNGKRNKELEKRIKETKSICNEITLVCKSTETSKSRIC